MFEDLGIQQAPNSTLCSYLNKLLWVLTGSFAKPGGQHLHSWFAPLFSPRPRRADAGHGRARHQRARPVQRHPRRDPHRPPRPLPRDARRELQPGALARRLAAHGRGARRAGAPRRDRRRDDGDRAARPLRPARREPVREGRGDVLQLRVPAQRVPPAPPAAGAAARHAPRARDLRADRPRAGGHRRRRPRSAARGGAGRTGRLRAGVRARRRPRTRGSRGSPRTSSTRRSARPCPTAWRGPPRSGGSPSAAR